MSLILKDIESNSTIENTDVEKASLIKAQQALHDYMQGLYAFSSEEEQVQFMAERVQLRFMGVINTLMENRNITSKQLAKELKTSQGHLTQLFKAERLINIRLLARLENIFNVKFELHYVEQE